MTALRSAVLDARDPHARAVWRDLERRAKPSYFLTSAWVDAWLASIESAPPMVALFDGERAVAAFFVGQRTLVRHHVVVSRARFLNRTGDERLDDLCIEHNQVLSAPGVRIALDDVILAIPGTWDELFLSGVDADGSGVDLRTCDDRHVVRIDHRVAAPFVDLERVRAAQLDYPSLLHANTRAQLRRAFKAFGRLDLEVATTPRHALDIYDELVRLHQRAWTERGETGAFGDPWVHAFHRRLIAARVEHGETQLLRVRASGQTVGCLYNLVAYGRVLFYQGGLAELADPKQKAGYVCHALAIDHAARAGHHTYDFLAGDGRYKRSLSTGATELVWARVQRPLARLVVEEQLRTWWHRIHDQGTRNP